MENGGYDDCEGDDEERRKESWLAGSFEEHHHQSESYHSKDSRSDEEASVDSLGGDVDWDWGIGDNMKLACPAVDPKYSSDKAKENDPDDSIRLQRGFLLRWLEWFYFFRMVLFLFNLILD